MKITQHLTKTGRWGVFLFFAGPAMTLITRYFLLEYIRSLRGTGITQVPDFSGFYALEIVGLLMLAASIPMMILGREFTGREIPADNGMWR